MLAMKYVLEIFVPIVSRYWGRENQKNLEI